MYGQKQKLEFAMTNSNCVMVGRFFTFSYDAVDSRQQHSVAIEEYYPCIPDGSYKRGTNKFVCVAGQSFNQYSGEWIEYIPPQGGTVSPYKGGQATLADCLDFTVLPPIHTLTDDNSLESRVDAMARGMKW